MFGEHKKRRFVEELRNYFASNLAPVVSKTKKNKFEQHTICRNGKCPEYRTRNLDLRLKILDFRLVI